MNFLIANHTPTSIDNAIRSICAAGLSDKLDREALNAIHVLVQSHIKKTVARVKALDCPFKLASLFLADKKEIRSYLQNIYSNGTQLVASSGHILIRINHAIAPGYYQNNGIKIDGYEPTYPNFMRVFEGFKSGVECSIDAYTPKHTAQNKIAYVYEQCAIDEKYITLLRSLGIKTVIAHKTCIYFQGVTNTGISFDGVIMYLKV